MKKMFLCVALSLQIFASETKQMKLSDDIRALLSQEMQYIKSGMNDIFEALISGNNATVMDVATKIEHSFIFKKNLTQDQKQELRIKLSREFMEYDQEFHSTAQQLANFAEFDDRASMINTYSSMIKQCIRCHEKYATQTFTNFQDIN